MAGRPPLDARLPDAATLAEMARALRAAGYLVVGHRPRDPRPRGAVPEATAVRRPAGAASSAEDALLFEYGAGI